MYAQQVATEGPFSVWPQLGPSNRVGVLGSQVAGQCVSRKQVPLWMLHNCRSAAKAIAVKGN